MESPLDMVITSIEAAELYGIDPSTIRKAITQGRLTARKSGSNRLAPYLLLREETDRIWGNRTPDNPIRAGRPKGTKNRPKE